MASAISAPAAAPASASTLGYSVTKTSAGTVRWNPCQRRVTYRVNASLAGSSSAARVAAVADVRGAFARLSKATGITFVYLGGSTRIPTGSTWKNSTGDAEITVAWVNQRSSTRRSSLLLRSSSGGYTAATGGFASWSWPSYSGVRSGTAIMRGYVVVNSAMNSRFRSGFGSGTTRGEMLLHELGHVVGLNHVSSSSQLMYPVLIARTVASYKTGDLRGLSVVGRPAGCVSVPRLSGLPADL